MIVWISGAYGVGKSTLAEALSPRMNGAIIFDAEELGNAVRENYPGEPFGVVFEDYPLWSEFCIRLLKDIAEKYDRDILVPMTLVRKKSQRIIDTLKKDGLDTRLVILEASHKTVHDRILMRGEDEDCWCIENIEMSRNGSGLLDGIKISADGRTPEEIAEEVLYKLEYKS